MIKTESAQIAYRTSSYHNMHAWCTGKICSIMERSGGREAHSCNIKSINIAFPLSFEDRSGMIHSGSLEAVKFHRRRLLVEREVVLGNCIYRLD